jgi:hypothetical protein
MRDLTRGRFAEIWRRKRAGEKLDEDDESQARQMELHPEYYHVWEKADRIKKQNYTVKGANPFMHITLHTIVEKQLQLQDPPEVSEVYRLKTLAGEDPHEVVHQIASVLVHEIYEVLKRQCAFNHDRYVREVKKLL